MQKHNQTGGWVSSKSLRLIERQPDRGIFGKTMRTDKRIDKQINELRNKYKDRWTRRPTDIFDQFPMVNTYFVTLSPSVNRRRLFVWTSLRPTSSGADRSSNGRESQRATD